MHDAPRMPATDPAWIDPANRSIEPSDGRVTLKNVYWID
jgi:hypothetical protein